MLLCIMDSMIMDSMIKGVFLDGYESKLNRLKDELWKYMDAILNNE